MKECLAGRSRRLHSGGGASAESVGRRCTCPVLCGWGTKSDAYSQQTDGTIQGSVSSVYQQARPSRCQPEESSLSIEVRMQILQFS